MPVTDYPGILLPSCFSLLAEYELISCLFMSCLQLEMATPLPKIPCSECFVKHCNHHYLFCNCTVEYIVRKSYLVSLTKKQNRIPTSAFSLLHTLSSPTCGKLVCTGVKQKQVNI